MTLPETATGALPTPGLWRRLACFFYEGVLLFGVVMGAGFVYSLDYCLFRRSGGRRVWGYGWFSGGWRSSTRS